MSDDKKSYGELSAELLRDLRRYIEDNQDVAWTSIAKHFNITVQQACDFYIDVLQDSEGITMDSTKMRTQIERACVTALVDELDKAGFVPTKVWDGGVSVTVSDTESTLAAVFAVDEATIHFARKDGVNVRHEHGVAVILGNGEDCISDWHVGDDAFAEALERVCDRIDKMTFTVNV
jgi:hypothetical protein